MDAAAGPLADVEHGEHLDDDGVSWVGVAAFEHEGFAYPDSAGVLEDEPSSCWG